jgi:pyridoxal phosphate enzyme (YggS family)
MGSLAENHRAVEARIRAACARAGRDPAEVRLIWVSKNHPQARAMEALGLGARLFGENRVQEALEKFPLPGVGPEAYQLHLIGRLQKNKVRKILPLASAIHSIDSPELLAAVDRIAGELGLKRDVFLQVNTSREPAKGGFEPGELLPFLASMPPLSHVRLVGLMTIGPLETPEGGPAGPEEARRCFRELRGLLEAARAAAGPAVSGGLGGSKGPAVSDGLGGPKALLHDFAWLSMGMTGDFEAAIEEGAHFIRIGTALFGARETVAPE